MTAVMGAVMEQIDDSQKELGFQMMLRMADDIQKVPVHDLLSRTSMGLQASF